MKTDGNSETSNSKPTIIQHRHFKRRVRSALALGGGPQSLAIQFPSSTRLLCFHFARIPSVMAIYLVNPNSERDFSHTNSNHSSLHDSCAIRTGSFILCHCLNRFSIPRGEQKDSVCQSGRHITPRIEIRMGIPGLDMNVHCLNTDSYLLMRFTFAIQRPRYV
jgi:hypothetical protein